MSEQTAHDISVTPDKETIAVFHYLNRRKWKYASYLLIIFIFSAFVLKYRILNYSSTATFYINDINILSSAAVDLRTIDNISPSDNLSRIFQQANSTLVHKHLIGQFNLVRHYGIDSTREFYKEEAMNILRANISVTKTPFNNILVTVSDKYRYLAADMSNEIVNFIDKMNKDFYIGNLERKLQVSEAFLKEMKKDNLIKSTGVDSIIYEIHSLVYSTSKQPVNSIYLLVQEQRMADLIGKLQSSTNDLMNSQKLYNLSLQAMNQKYFPTLTVVQTAMPAAKSNLTLSVILAALVTFLAAILIIFQTYFRLRYRNYFSLMTQPSAVQNRQA